MTDRLFHQFPTATETAARGRANAQAQAALFDAALDEPVVPDCHVCGAVGPCSCEAEGSAPRPWSSPMPDRTTHLLARDEETGNWRCCSCPPGSICPLPALHAADAAFRAQRRWSPEAEKLAAEAGEMVGTFLWPEAGISDEDRRRFALSVEADPRSPLWELAVAIRSAHTPWVPALEDCGRGVQEMWLRAAKAALDLLRQEPSRCTGLAATWCPVHGDCTCPSYGLGGDPEERDLDDPTCPLHSASSTHAKGEVG